MNACQLTAWAVRKGICQIATNLLGIKALVPALARATGESMALRIALVSSEFPPEGGGIGIYVQKLALGLAQRGHTVDILTRRLSRAEEVRPVEPGVRISRFRHLPLFPLGNLGWGDLVSKYIRSVGDPFDLVNVHSPAPVIVRTKSPTVLTIHNIAGLNTERLVKGGGIPSLEGMMKTPISIFERAVIRTYHRFAVMSGSIARQLVEIYGLSRNAISVVGNGVDCSFFTPLPSRPSSGQILYAGRFHRGKNLDVLFQAFRLVVKRHPNARLTLSGTGPYENHLRSVVKNMEIGRNLTFTSWLSGDSYALAVRSALICVLPSASEGQSTAVLEAMASGVPVVVADIANNRELVHDGRDGLLFRPYDSTDLARCIDSLLIDSSLRESIGTEARKTVLADFQWSQVMDRYHLVYESLGVG